MKTKTKYVIRLLSTSIIFFILVNNCPFAESEPSGSLLINEVMYHPAEDENYNEWIELYNPTSFPIDVTGWTISDGQEDDTLQGDNIHGDGSATIPSNGYAVVTDKGTQVYDTSSIPDDAIRLSVDDSTLCGYGLKNSGEKIILYDAEGTAIDAMEWGEDDDVPGTPAPLVNEGCSLARYPGVDTDDSLADFFEYSTPTPGGENVGETPRDEQSNDSETSGDTTTPTSAILIIELYYYTHSTIQNEFVTILNPSETSVDLTGWYLTDEPWKDVSEQAKILFPDHTILPPHTSWSITQNASAFERETGHLSDFEYKVDSRPDIPQMKTYKTITLSNTGGLIGIIDDETNTVDLVVYGDTEYAPAGWDGPPILSSNAGVILKRTMVDGLPVDSNTASDWVHPRIYRIGQSDFPVQTMTFTGEITTFTSPDSSFQTIVDELRNAHTSIDINMYEFTHPALCKELVAALKRNVTVRLFMEGSPVGGMDDREKYILKTIAQHGGLVRCLVSNTTNHVYARYQFDHAKYIIIDNVTVIVESCNWAKSGVPEDPTSGNREWGIVVRNQEVAAQFLQVFQEDWDPQWRDSCPFEALNFTIPSGFTLDESVPTGSYTPQLLPQTISGSFTITPLFSPDNSEQAILDALDTATTSIYVEQLYIYSTWGNTISPLVERLMMKADQGVDVKVILNYNPMFEDGNNVLNKTKQILEEHGVHVKVLSTAWAPFTAVHNKGMIIDNTTVLISSINWNEQSVRENREAGILIRNEEAATFYATVFFSDWALEEHHAKTSGFSWAEYKNLMLIAVVCLITAFIIIRDWRKRKWR